MSPLLPMNAAQCPLLEHVSADDPADQPGSNLDGDSIHEDWKSAASLDSQVIVTVYNWLGSRHGWQSLRMRRCESWP